MRRGVAAAATAALLAGVLVLGGGSAATAQAPQVCLGDPSAQGVPMLPGPLLRLGINPAGEAGALGPPVPAVPEDPVRTLDALARLRKVDSPFVVRLNRFFWSEEEAAVQRFLALTQRYTALGYGVELQLRYHPRPDQEGDIAAWTEWVRSIVRRFGPNPRVLALQVTNEVNFTISPDSSDGSYRGARDALIEGVIAAKDEARRGGFDHLAIGFNWFYRTDPANEDSFWNYLRDRGGAPFRDAVDWVGLDAYPGTFFPPAEYPGGGRDGMVAAISSLRECWMPRVGLSPSVPIHVEENGWPTGPGRSEAQQAEELRTMVTAVHDFRGTYNVTDYRWFDLRDHRTSSSNFQHHYGLLRDDYSPKPAFDVYRQLVQALSRPNEAAPYSGAVRAARPPAPPPPARVLPFYRYASRYVGPGARCARRPIRITIGGPESGAIARVDFHVGTRRVGIDTFFPFTRSLAIPRFAPSPRHRLSASVLMRDGRRRAFARILRVCRP